MTPRLKHTISKEIEPTLKEKFGYKNLYMGPRIQKIVLNMGLGLDGNDQKILKSCQEDLANITGQFPVFTKFRKSIANFKSDLDSPVSKFTYRYDEHGNLAYVDEYKNGVHETHKELLYESATFLLKTILIQDVSTNFIKIIKFKTILR